MLWVLLAVLVVAVVGLYLMRERGVGRGDAAGSSPESFIDDPEVARGTRSRTADAPGIHPGTADTPRTTPDPPAVPASEPLSPAHQALTQLNQALDVHTPRTEAARQALEAAADRRRVAGFLLARADPEQAELTAREGLFYIRAARIAMRMDPGPALPPLPAQAEAGEVPETRTRTFQGTRITASPSPSPATPHHHPGGRIADRLIPAGWYSEQWWRPALASGTWPPGTDALFTALFADEPPRPGAGIGLDRKEPGPSPAPSFSSPSPEAPTPPVLDRTPPDPAPPPHDPPAGPSSEPAGDNSAPPNPAETPIPAQDSPSGAPAPTHRDLPYDDPQYRANGYGITANHPAPGNNGAEYRATTRNGHRPHGPRGYEDLGGYEGGAYDPGGLDPPY
ncbi:hypothetical protein AB0H71_12820 [Nocardia sp. NPDC050697]|uniref:hypothetical protein n=1 Tax=Nocardia sp. NPDC050697 TaxID=3155158 RepID=UPI0033D4861B